MPSGGLAYPILSEDKRNSVILNFMRGISSTISAISGLLMFPCFIAIVVGILRSAALRRPGVSYFAAASSSNILFHPELYVDEAAGPRELHRRGFAAFFLFLVVGLSAAFCHRWTTRL